jgi:hypothetical protein
VSTRAHVLVLIVTLSMIVFILRLVRLRQLRSKYALIWLITAIVLLPLGLFPGVLEPIANWLGVDYAPTAFAFVAVGFLFLVVVHFSWELSRLETRVRKLAEELALQNHDRAPRADKDAPAP